VDVEAKILGAKVAEKSLNRYGALLEGVAVYLSDCCLDGKPYAEIYVFLEELPIEEEDIASEILASIKEGECAGVSVFVFTLSEVERRRGSLIEALKVSHIAYDRSGRIKRLLET